MQKFVGKPREELVFEEREMYLEDKLEDWYLEQTVNIKS